MSVRIGEKPVSRNRDSVTAETREYFVAGTTSADVVLAEVFTHSPSVLLTLAATLWRKSLEISLKWEAPDYCSVTVPYAVKSREDENPEEGSFTWGFDSTGGTVNIKAGEHIATYGDGPADGHNGAIGVHGDEVDGTEVVIPAGKFNVSFTHPKGQLTLARAFQLIEATGSVNDGTFFTKPKGSFLFLGAAGDDGSDAPATVSYQFAYSKNLQNKIIGGITVIEKEGWDVAWIKFKDADVAGGKPIKPPEYISVERVYERISFPSTFGFG